MKFSTQMAYIVTYAYFRFDKFLHLKMATLLMNTRSNYKKNDALGHFIAMATNTSPFSIHW